MIAPPAGRSRTLLILAGLVLTAALTAACGGGGGDNERAERIARAALLTPDDLPGGGWREAYRDTFASAQGASQSEACRQFHAAIEGIETRLARGRQARAQVGLSRPVPGSAYPLTVEATVAVFDKSSGLPEAVAEFRELVSSPAFPVCFDEDFRQRAGSRVRSTAFSRVTVLGTAPAGAAAATEVEYELDSPPATGTLRLEGYEWASGNVRVTVYVLGAREGFTQQLVESVLSRLQARLAQALQANP